MKIPIGRDISIALLTPTLADSLFNLTNQNRAYLKRWLSWLDLVKCLEDTQTFIETAVYHHNQGNGSSFGIFFHDKLVGVAGYNHFDHQHRIGSIGYWLGEAYTGKGIVNHVVSQLVSYGFIEHNLNKIEIRCAPENTKSRAIPERLGFTFEATLRHCEWLYDRFVDHAVYSLLRCEYEQAKIQNLGFNDMK